jgi:hypothetical protein
MRGFAGSSSASSRFALAASATLAASPLVDHEALRRRIVC